jgi:hypothetical protein
MRKQLNHKQNALYVHLQDGCSGKHLRPSDFTKHTQPKSELNTMYTHYCGIYCVWSKIKWGINTRMKRMADLESFEYRMAQKDVATGIQQQMHVILISVTGIFNHRLSHSTLFPTPPKPPREKRKALLGRSIQMQFTLSLSQYLKEMHFSRN